MALNIRKINKPVAQSRPQPAFFSICEALKMPIDSTLIDAAEKSYIAGRLHQTVLITDAALKKYPDEGRIWELKGLAHRALGEAKPAMQALETATLLVPLRPAARCALADCYAYAGHGRLAHDMYLALADDSQTPPELWLPIATGFDFVGAPALALSVCRWAIQWDPDSPQAWHDFGCYLGRCGYAPRLVLNCARRAVSLDPKTGRWRIGLVSLLYQAGHADEAHAAARKLTDLQIADAICPCCLLRVAEVFDAYGDLQRGDACRRRAAKFAPAVDSDS